MTILRLSTLSLALAVSVFALGVANPAFSAKPNCQLDPNHPSCGDDGGVDGITYTAELTGRVFNFEQVNVTPNAKQDHLLPDPAATLIFTRPDVADPVAQATWDAVFAACENFFAPPVVYSFQVPADSWQIAQPGGVRVQLQIPFDEAGKSPPITTQEFHVSLQLVGDTFFDSPNDSFLPVPVNSDPIEIEYSMIDTSMSGRTEKGVRPKTGCVSGGSPDEPDFPAGTESTLVITATPTP